MRQQASHYFAGLLNREPGEPSIEVVPGSRDELIVGVWMMEPGDAEVVAKRLRQILKAAA